MVLHRKLWEWCFITQALHCEGMLQPGRRGLGFAVGKEPLVGQFAALGASILASDLDIDRAAEAGWVASGEHAAALTALNGRGLCPQERFDQLVEFRPIDMLDLPTDELTDFDFLWSSCAFEHLGSLEAGIGFVVNAMKCLRPGGLAVHTTEFNVASNDDTVCDGGTVIYRQRDIEHLVEVLRAQGHQIVVDFNRGTTPTDYYVDIPPYHHHPHLKLHLLGHVTTSIGIVARHR